jgi:hypothetical protein
MVHAGTDYLAVVTAAVAAWLWGAAWYFAIWNRWVKAARRDSAAPANSAAPLVVSFIAKLAIAFVLAGAIGHLGTGQVTLRNGVVSGAIIWAGFMVTIMAVDHRYQGFGWDLTLIDAGHWLGVMLIAGAIIGWWGV